MALLSMAVIVDNVGWITLVIVNKCKDWILGLAATSTTPTHAVEPRRRLRQTFASHNHLIIDLPKQHMAEQNTLLIWQESRLPLWAQ